MIWQQQYEIIKKKISDDLAKKGQQASFINISKFLGVSRGKVEAWARGQRPSADDLKVIAEKLGFSPTWLLMGTGDPFQGEAGAEPDGFHETPGTYRTITAGPEGERIDIITHHPAVGVVIDASGIEPGHNHLLEYILAPGVAARTNTDGSLKPEGRGVALLKHWVEARAEVESLRTLPTAHGLAVFDASDTREMPGSLCVISVGGILNVREMEVGMGEIMWTDPDNKAPAIVVPMDEETPESEAAKVKVLGRVVWMIREA